MTNTNIYNIIKSYLDETNITKNELIFFLQNNQYIIDIIIEFMKINKNEDITTKIITEIDYFLCFCPHCKIMIQIYKKDINCTIFRCGVHKHNLQPINPHTSKYECDRLFDDELIFGCGKPFKFDGKIISTCDYI